MKIWLLRIHADRKNNVKLLPGLYLCSYSILGIIKENYFLLKLDNFFWIITTQQGKKTEELTKIIAGPQINTVYYQSSQLSDTETQLVLKGWLLTLWDSTAEKQDHICQRTREYSTTSRTHKLPVQLVYLEQKNETVLVRDTFLSSFAIFFSCFS